MKILWVATKAPWPPSDGGRLLMAETIAGLADRGHYIEVIYPSLTAAESTPTEIGPLIRLVAVPCRPRPLWRDTLRSWRRDLPLTLARHDHPEMVVAATRLLDSGAFDVVFAEQVHAWSALRQRSNLPAFLRAQNVESDLWRDLAPFRPWLGPWLRAEARRLALAEAAALREATATLALSQEDRDRLAELEPKARVELIRPPMPADRPAGPALQGAPALVLFGSSGWRPNQDGSRFFLDKVWPRLAQLLPQACLHVFGAASNRAADRLFYHSSPAESRAALAAGSLLVVPLFVGSGVRMKILEAWARGVAVVASPIAARGLGVEDGQGLRLATDAAEFCAVLTELANDSAQVESLIAAGRARLRVAHDPRACATALEQLYETARVKAKVSASPELSA